MPTPDRWAKAIVEAGFDVQLDMDFDVDSFTGFLPCKYKRVESGFEYFASQLSKEERAELELPDSYDFGVTLVTHADLREAAVALVAAGVLCKITSGVFVDPQEGESRSAADVMDYVREGVPVLEREF